MSPVPDFLGIIALPYESSTSFIQGTVHGPVAIENQLKRLDTFDLNLGADPFAATEYHFIRPHGNEAMTPDIQQILAQQATGDVLANGGFPFAIGGEHTVSLGPIKAALTQGHLGVVQLDAHADLRATYEGNPYSHACVMRRAFELDCPIVGVGIRSISGSEMAFMSRSSCIHHVGDRTAEASTDWYSVLDQLPERIYLTVDMDVFNPEQVAAVGTPEPGGLRWNTVCDFLNHLFETKQVVAADIVELCPGTDDGPSVRLATRLLGTIVYHRFKPDQ